VPIPVEAMRTKAARFCGNLSARLRGEGGYSLVEMLTVMTILAVVLAPIVTSFTSGMRQEVDQTRREEAYSNVRLALQRMRLDIHCSHSHAAQLPVQQNSYGGFTLTLSENPGQCPGVVPSTSNVSAVEWCTIPVGGSSTRFQLFRYNAATLAACDGSAGSTFETDYITAPPSGWPTNANTTPTPSSWAGNIWPTIDTCGAGSLPTVSVDMNVALDPVNFPNERYELTDRIASMNADPC